MDHQRLLFKSNENKIPRMLDSTKIRNSFLSTTTRTNLRKVSVCGSNALVFKILDTVAEPPFQLVVPVTLYWSVDLAKKFFFETSLSNSDETI